MTSPTFAEAQQRVLARRAAREASFSRMQQQPQSSYSSVWTSITTSLTTLARPAFRVGQLDASLLDQELVELLRAHVSDGLKLFAGGALSQDWSSEIQLALHAVLFKLTVWDHDTTYGAALQNLRYSDARHKPGSVIVPPTQWQKGAYGLVTVLGRYAWDRWEGWLRERDDGLGEDIGDGREDAEIRRKRIRTMAKMTEWARTVHAAAAIVSFLVFLLRGRYRTLLDRVLRIKLVPPTSQVSREMSFEYQNRQLVWHAFTEFLLFTLPLLGISRWRRWLSRTWRRTKAVLQSNSTAQGDDIQSPPGEYSFLPERTCAICYQEQNTTAMTESEAISAVSGSGGVIGSTATDITSPYEAAPCGCVYCFVCIANCLDSEEGDGWTCLRCGTLVRECRPWGGDVLDHKRKGRSVSGKTVAFEEDVVRGVIDDDAESL